MESTTSSTLDPTRLWALSNAQLVDALQDADRAEKRAAALKLALVREADARGIAQDVGAANAQQWVAGLLRIPTAEAGALVKLARHVDRELPATAAALESGDISVAHARAISKVVHDLPSDVSTPTLRADVDSTLAQHARSFDAPTVRRLGDRVLQQLDPDLADRVLAKQLQLEEARAERDRFWRMGRDPVTGTWRVDARLPALVGEQLKAIIDPLAAPQPGPDGSDTRTPEQRNADAVGEIAHRMLAEQRVPSHGGNPTQLVVSVTRDGTGRTLASGIELSARLVQRLMCEADLALLVRPHDAPGAVTLVADDRARLFQRRLRRLLEHRDQGCAFPGCDRPPSWCHAHHIVPWSKGGPTTLANGVLLCGHHHRLVHQGAWAVRLAQDGYPEFVPPDWIDPRRIPVRNTRLTPAA